jgi:hypothetical protein
VCWSSQRLVRESTQATHHEIQYFLLPGKRVVYGRHSRVKALQSDPAPLTAFVTFRAIAKAGVAVDMWAYRTSALIGAVCPRRSTAAVFWRIGIEHRDPL